MSDRPTSQDVLLALLALDSYSRGKNAQILEKTGQFLATTIGSANWNVVSDTLLPDSISTGFSASKYTLMDGTSVIAYRGTDFTSNIGVALDIAAWFSSFGVLGDSAGVKLQPYYAQQFYERVTGRLLFPDGGGSGTPGSNVIITGHSLGGSLAGYVASLSHDQAVIFNEIPYIGLALTKAINTYIDSIKDRPDFSTLVAQLVQLLTGQGISFPSFNLPTAGNITSFQTIGEIAQYARTLGPFAGFLAQFALGPLSAAIGTAAFGYGSATSEPTVKMNPYDGGLQGAVTLHSQALMVLLTYAASKSYEDWQAIGPQLLNALFSDDVANADNAAALLRGYAGPAQKLMDAIAYSTVAPGPGSGTVFGDTGASALFNDANELGKVIKSGPSAFFRKIVSTRRQSWFSSALTYTDVKQEIASLVAQYAGALALNKVTSSGGLIATPNGPVDVTDGILSLSKGADGSPGVLSVDVSSVLWKDVLGTKVDPIGLADFRTAFFGQAPMTDGIVNRKFISWLLGTNKIDDEALKFLAKGGWGATTTDIFDRFDIATSDQGGKVKIEERSYDPGELRGNNAHVDVYIGSKKNEDITGTRGDDLILGVSGTDRIDGGAGNDVIVAGTGSNSVTIGGVGRDVVINFSQGGVVYGDTVDRVDANGNPVVVADTEANADIFWYAPGIKIMDAQLHDRLVFQGTPLTGGSRNPAYFASAQSAPFFVGVFTPGTAISAVIAGAAQLAGIYFDKLFPSITYKMDKNGTLKIGNIWDGLLRWVTGRGGIFSSGSGNGDDLRGVMAVRNFNFQHSAWGYQQAELAAKGTFGMSFKDDNPLNLLLSYAAELGGIFALPEIIYMQTLLLYDEVLAEASAIQSAAKTAKWIAGGDPLVIDLAGNGIETTTLDGSSVYFNLDGRQVHQPHRLAVRYRRVPGSRPQSQRHDRRHPRNVRHQRSGRLFRAGAIRRQP